MKQSELHEAAKRCGFTVILFADHPSFFSYWSITVKRNENTYVIEHEGRDGWLIFYREKSSNKLEEVDKKISHAMTDDDKVDQCEMWLSAIA